VAYAGGGGGSIEFAPWNGCIPATPGGVGGGGGGTSGGPGPNISPPQGTAGTANTGGGGGAGADAPFPFPTPARNGNAGGSGIVITRFPSGATIAVAPCTNSVATLPAPEGGYKVATFTVSGTLTVS
jgi:hypothetical protein